MNQKEKILTKTVIENWRCRLITTDSTLLTQRSTRCLINERLRFKSQEDVKTRRVASKGKRLSK